MFDGKRSTRNLIGETALDVATTDIAADVIRSQSKISLKFLAPRVVKRYAEEYNNPIPSCIREFVDLH